MSKKGIKIVRTQWGFEVTNEQDFVDYYDLLQVQPDCDMRTLEVVYHHLAKQHHPDHTANADVARFQQVLEAYRVLKDPDRRAEYDEIYYANLGERPPQTAGEATAGINSKTAVSDAEAHEKILLYLYKNRREDANNAGVVEWLLKEMLDCQDDLFEFHIWYLKSKGFLELTERGTLAITIAGVDHVIEHSRAEMAEELFLTGMSAPIDPDEQPGDGTE